jgi:hypothetical protein
MPLPSGNPPLIKEEGVLPFLHSGSEKLERDLVVQRFDLALFDPVISEFGLSAPKFCGQKTGAMGFANLPRGDEHALEFPALRSLSCLQGVGPI